MLWEVISKVVQVLNTVIMMGIIFLIDLSFLDTQKAPCACRGIFLDVVTQPKNCWCCLWSISLDVFRPVIHQKMPKQISNGFKTHKEIAMCSNQTIREFLIFKHTSHVLGQMVHVLKQVIHAFPTRSFAILDIVQREDLRTLIIFKQWMCES